MPFFAIMNANTIRGNMIKTNIFFNIIFNKKTYQPISIALLSECDKSFYFEFNDYNKNISTEIKNNLEFQRYNVLVNNLPIKFSGKGDFNNVCQHISKWLKQFDNVFLIGDSINYQNFNVNSIFSYYVNDITLLFTKNSLSYNHSRVKLSNSDTTRDFNHALCDCIVIKDCYYKLI